MPWTSVSILSGTGSQYLEEATPALTSTHPAYNASWHDWLVVSISEERILRCVRPRRRYQPPAEALVALNAESSPSPGALGYQLSLGSQPGDVSACSLLQDG